MRVTAVLVILLLAIGLNLGATMAQAADNAVIQPLPSACQTVSDAELSQMQGKFFGHAFAVRLHDRAANFWQNRVPTCFKESCVGVALRKVHASFVVKHNADSSNNGSTY